MITPNTIWKIICFKVKSVVRWSRRALKESQFPHQPLVIISPPSSFPSKCSAFTRTVLLPPPQPPRLTLFLLSRCKLQSVSDDPAWTNTALIPGSLGGVRRAERMTEINTDTLDVYSIRKKVLFIGTANPVWIAGPGCRDTIWTMLVSTIFPPSQTVWC